MIDKVANLNLSENKIDNLCDIFHSSGSGDNMKNYQLVELDLSRNRLNQNDSLSKLEHFTSLRFLNLGKNRISQLRHSVFDELVNIEYLLLDQNNLELSEPESGFILTRLNRLKMLSLSKNAI